MGVAGGMLWAEAYFLQKFGDPCTEGDAPGKVAHQQGLSDRNANSHTRIERCDGILEHHLGAGANGAQGLGIGAREFRAKDANAAAGGRDEADARIGDGGLAAAALADEAKGFAGRDR